MTDAQGDEIIKLLKELKDCETLQTSDIAMLKDNLEFIHKIRKVHKFCIKYKVYYLLGLVIFGGTGITARDIVLEFLKLF